MNDNQAHDCNTLQHATTRCNTLQHTATHCKTLQHNTYEWQPNPELTYTHDTPGQTLAWKCQHAATHYNYNILHHTATYMHDTPGPTRAWKWENAATHYNTLQYSATHCHTLRHICMTYQGKHLLPNGNTLQHTIIHCNTLQHTATYCTILKHAATQQICK